MPTNPSWDDELILSNESVPYRMSRISPTVWEVSRDDTSMTLTDEINVAPSTAPGEYPPRAQLYSQRVVCFDTYHNGRVHWYEPYGCARARLATDQVAVDEVAQWYAAYLERVEEERRVAREAERQRVRRMQERYWSLAEAAAAAWRQFTIRPGALITIRPSYDHLSEDHRDTLSDDSYNFRGMSLSVHSVRWTSSTHPDDADRTISWPIIACQATRRHGMGAYLVTINPLMVESVTIQTRPVWPADLARRNVNDRHREFHPERVIDTYGDHHEEYEDEDERFDDHSDECGENACRCCACECGYRPYNNGGGSALINEYSYRPTPRFRGDGPVYLGAELEIDTRQGNTDRIARRVLADWGSDHVYLKQDGSVEGFEIVSHPMTYDYWRTHIDVSKLPTWADMNARPHESCGLHVHVSRDAFSDPVHQFKWMKLFYRNRRLVETVARRRDSSYARFSLTDETHSQYMKHYAKGGVGGERYQAINAGNSDTFEVRVFASTLTESEFLASLALVDASVEYTRQLSTRDIIANGGWSAEAFTEYVMSQEKYSELAEMLAPFRG